MNRPIATLADKPIFPETAASHARRVLVIDDDEFICKTMASQLLSLGMSGVTTSTGDQATIRLLNEGGPFDLIVADLAMPHYSGIQLTRLIAARQAKAAVLYISSQGRARLDQAAEMAREQGLRVLPVLQKPIRVEHLRDALEALNQVPPAVSPAATPATAPRRTADILEQDALLRLIDRLGGITRLHNDMVVLRERAAASKSDAELARAAEETGTLLHQHCTRLEGERASALGLLTQMTAGLDAMTAHLDRDADFRREARDLSRQRDRDLEGEMTAMDDDIRQARDLTALQADVRKRLDRIGSNLQESRAREEALVQELERRGSQMKSRIESLEQETAALRESAEREHLAASTDRLTGLPNRRAYDERIKQEWAQCRLAGRPLVLAVWDIDRFKAVNDTYGHAAGDKALQAVGQYLAKHVRATDFVARFGGEEFVMVLPGADPLHALEIAEQLRQGIERIGFRYQQMPIRLTASCGLAVFDDGESAEAVFERADGALYQAKQGGRNRCVVAQAASAASVSCA